MTTVKTVPSPKLRVAGWMPRSLLWWSVVALTVYLALDVARSLIAHFGYTAPVSTWQPDPAQYRDVEWPPTAMVPPGASNGQRVYLENCAICHGPDGRGNGAAAPSMSPRPRDLTTAGYKYKSTPQGAAPTTADLRKVVADGLTASAMPFFRDMLTAAEIDDVVGYVEALRSVPARRAAPLLVPRRPPVTSANVAHGEGLYRAQGCATCHGAELGGGAVLTDAYGQPVTSRDLTAPWSFRGGARPQDVFLRLTTGLGASPMPSFADLPAADRWDLVAFLESRARAVPGEPGGVLGGPGQSQDALSRGRYLVRAGMCGLCHTEVSAKGIYRDEHYLAGGTRVGAHPQGVFVSRNLTSDPDTGLGRWSEQQIVRAIRDGRTDDGRLLNVFSMPWVFLHNISQTDATAIARYLKTLPAVHNQIPPPLHFGAIETFFSKLWASDLFLGRPPAITYATGSFANLKGPDLARLQGTLIAAQWMVLALWVALLSWLVPLQRWAPLGRRSWTGVLGCSFGLVIYSTPILGVLPAELLSQQALGAVPRPDLSALPAERAALVERGRYLFTNASCVFCHQPNGGGGLKLSGLPGTLFTANISSDPDAGIGRWSDAEIGRAIRSGVSRNGRPLYWQGMPWDHFSNLDEEDVMALTAYLRLLPPVPEKVEAYRPPAAGDCAIYTAWTSPNNASEGCR
ncbi:MAG TPA: c-type cytochrome [Rhodopseudomonas sp.]|uniref:c-type cytochrome n=1 Tax=Rhodopseudomonas sp. TaxID=1078 RepID=UPI002ED95BB0